MWQGEMEGKRSIRVRWGQVERKKKKKARRLLSELPSYSEQQRVMQAKRIRKPLYAVG